MQDIFSMKCNECEAEFTCWRADNKDVIKCMKCKGTDLKVLSHKEVASAREGVMEVFGDDIGDLLK